MPKILVVEDCAEHQLMIRKVLADRFEVVAVDGIQSATDEIRRQQFDLVLLDAGLPDGDGFSLCTEIRSNERTRDVPVLFVTARTSVQDKVFGFSVGADDYIVKPFEPLELRARVEARLSRHQQKRDGELYLSKGDLRLQVDSLKAVLMQGRDELDLGLTPAEFKILHYFVRNDGRILSRGQILAKVWGENVAVVDRIVDKHISSLRKKLGHRSIYIRTVSRLGYRFGIPQ